MSAYIHFFVRKDNTFLPIGTYSRSTAIYELFSDYAPWEKVRPLNESLLMNIYDEQHQNIENWKARIAQEYELAEQIGQFNNSVDDKLEALNDCQTNINEFNEILEENCGALSFVGFLREALDDADTSCHYEQESIHLDPAHYIYCGIETGLNIGPEDIEE